MPEGTIAKFIAGIDRVLMRSGHLFVWAGKFRLGQDAGQWTEGSKLETVDLVTWDKGPSAWASTPGAGPSYRLVLHKDPTGAKGVRNAHDIPDVIDPTAGSLSAMEAAVGQGRRFRGCDLEG